jgi:uncharacterized LabA/DUF88 family protein
MTKRNSQKIYAFIDSQNLNLAVHALGWKLDFRRFLIYLKSKYNVTKAFLFLGYIPENKDLYDHLKNCGYEIVFKPTVKTSKKDATKGNVDAELVLHSAKIQFPNYQKAIIVSNDGDFYCLIEHLKDENKLLKLITPSTRYSSLLRSFSTFIVPVPLFKHKVEYIKREAFPQHG